MFHGNLRADDPRCMDTETTVYDAFDEAVETTISLAQRSEIRAIGVSLVNELVPPA